MAKKKGFSAIWEIIEIPVYIYFLWSILSLVTMSQGWLDTLALSIIGWVVNLGVFGFIGYKAVKATPKIGYAAKSGAWAGVIIGLFAAVLSIISYYVAPQIFTESIQKAVEQGAARDTVETMISFGIYIGLITTPLISAAIGAAISSIAGLIFKK